MRPPRPPSLSSVRLDNVCLTVNAVVLPLSPSLSLCINVWRGEDPSGEEISTRGDTDKAESGTDRAGSDRACYTASSSSTLHDRVNFRPQTLLFLSPIHGQCNSTNSTRQCNSAVGWRRFYTAMSFPVPCSTTLRWPFL